MTAERVVGARTLRAAIEKKTAPQVAACDECTSEGIPGSSAANA
jgi:hypothetical protein